MLKKIIPPVIEVKDLMPAAVSIFEALQPVLKVVIDTLGVLPPIIKAFRWHGQVIGVIKPVSIFSSGWEVAQECGVRSLGLWRRCGRVGRAISNGMHWISGVWSNAWNGIKSFVKGLWDGIVEVFREGVGAIGNTFKSIEESYHGPV